MFRSLVLAPRLMMTLVVNEAIEIENLLLCPGVEYERSSGIDVGKGR